MYVFVVFVLAIIPDMVRQVNKKMSERKHIYYRYVFCFKISQHILDIYYLFADINLVI